MCVLQNFVRTNSWESYTSNAGTTIHLYDGHFCQGQFTNSLRVALGLHSESAGYKGCMTCKWGRLACVHCCMGAYAPREPTPQMLCMGLMLKQLCLMQARTRDLCLQRRARSQVRLCRGMVQINELVAVSSQHWETFALLGSTGRGLPVLPLLQPRVSYLLLPHFCPCAGHASLLLTLMMSYIAGAHLMFFICRKPV